MCGALARQHNREPQQKGPAMHCAIRLERDGLLTWCEPALIIAHSFAVYRFRSVGAGLSVQRVVSRQFVFWRRCGG